MAFQVITLKIYEIYAQTAAGSVTTLALTNQIGKVCVLAPVDTQQDAIRLYRRGGSLNDGHYQTGVNYPTSSLVQGSCGAGYYEIDDNVADTGLGTIVQLDNDVPVTSITQSAVPLPFIWGPFGGRVLGCGDSNRPDAVYFSKVGNADAWGPQQWVTTSNPSEPMMMGCVYNTRNFAFSTEQMYELVLGLSPGVTFTPFPTPCGKGLISPWGLCVNDAVYFVSKDGIYRTDGGVAQSLVDDSIKPLFPTKDTPGISVHGYQAVDMTRLSSIRLNYHNGEIYFTYAGATDGTLQTLAFDLQKPRWRAAQYNPSVLTFYSEPSTASSLLAAGSDGVLYQAAVGADNGASIPVVIRTGAQDQGLPLNHKEYGNVVFDIDPGGATVGTPITITPYINGEASAQSAIQVTGSGRQQVPMSLGDVIAFNLEFEIAWTRTGAINPILYQYDILWRPEPALLTHFETRESSFGSPGYLHIRDGYLGLRSTANVTITATVDGVALPAITLASTGGARRKVYFAMPANKGKVYRFSIDSAAQFKLYQEDCELRIKPWITNLGYKPVKAFGAEDTAVMGAYESRVLE